MYLHKYAAYLGCWNYDEHRIKIQHNHSTLINFLSNWVCYSLESFFNHLGISNFNWVFKISKKLGISITKRFSLIIHFTTKL